MRWLTALVVLALAGTAGAAPQAGAATDTTLQATWIAPTTYTDGSGLFDLREYRIYVSPNVCPHGAFISLTNPNHDINGIPLTNSPWAGLQETYTITGLVPNTEYTIQITALDSWSESDCSLPATARTLPGSGTPPTNVVDLRVSWNPVDRPLQIGDRIITDVNDVHNIRSGPDGSLTPIGQVPPGTTGVITNLAPGFYELRWDHPTTAMPNGWVAGQWITAAP